MRRLLALALCAGAAACGVEPARPMLAGANEMQARQGLFSGPSGDVLLIGVDPAPQEGAD